MRVSPKLALLLLFAVSGVHGKLPAQQDGGPDASPSLRLAERVPAPLAYFAVPGGEGASGLDSLLDDPAARLVWSSLVDESATRALEQLRELAALSAGEVEFTLNGLLAREGQPALPLLLCRVELSSEGAAKLQAALDDGRLGSPSEAISGRKTWLLASSPARRAGGSFELALVGRELLVSNSRAALEDVLRVSTGSGRTNSGAHAESIARHAIFAGQRAQLGAASQGNVLHIDWRRLRERALGRVGSAQALALDALGFGSAEHVTLGLRVEPDAVRTTAIVDQPRGPDGLLAASTPSTPRKLLADLPPLSLAAMTISVDQARLRALVRANDDVVGSRFGHGLAGGCRSFGLDFEEQVLPRLGGSGGVQLVLLDDSAERQGVAFSIAARSAAAARSVLVDLREGFERHRAERGRPGASGHGRGDHDHDRDGPPRGGFTLEADRELLTLRGPYGATSLGVVGDSLVLAPDRGTIERLAELEKGGARDRSRTRARTQDLCDRILAGQASSKRAPIGVVQIDGSLLARDGTPRAAGAADGRHAGLLFLDDGALRIELVSPR